MQAKEDAEDAVQGKSGCCGGGIYTEVYDPSKAPPEHPGIIAARNAKSQSGTQNVDVLATDLDGYEEKDDYSFSGSKTDDHQPHDGSNPSQMRKMDSLVYTDSDSENTGHDNGQSVVIRKLTRKKPKGGQLLPGMDKDDEAELSAAHQRSIGGHNVPRTLPNRKRDDSEEDIFGDMDEF